MCVSVCVLSRVEPRFTRGRVFIGGGNVAVSFPPGPPLMILNCRLSLAARNLSNVIWPRHTEFYRVLPSFTTVFGGLQLVQRHMAAPCRFTEFYRILPNFTEFYRVLPSFATFYGGLQLVQSHKATPCRLTEFYLVFTNFYLVLPSFT